MKWICRARLMILAVALAMLAPVVVLSAGTPAGAGPHVVIDFYWGEGCPHCAKARPFLEELARREPGVEMRSYEVFRHQENVDRLQAQAKAIGKEATGVPTIFVGTVMFNGFSPEKGEAMAAEVRRQLAANASAVPAKEVDGTIAVPLIGAVETTALSLPALTVVVAGLDSFNPCAFFVLLFLLSLLIHAHSRLRMILIGGTFVLFSGLVYFLFMAAWLNLFLMVGHLQMITIAAGVVALVVAGLNIKDFFLFHHGVSLTIPEAAKPKLFERMRRILGEGRLPVMLAGTVVLALAANSYELLCTAGFPMVFTRVLTLNPLSQLEYYGYLAFYNTVYIIPLAVIVAIFVVTLGSRKLSEWQGRELKLISGLMMFGFGVVLLVRPALLNNALASVILLAATLALAALVIQVTKRLRPDLAQHNPEHQ